MNVLITGGDGFIARNLRQHLAEKQDVQVYLVVRSSSENEVREAIQKADFVFHLAGVNRPKNPSEFVEGNVNFTAFLCEQLRQRAERGGGRPTVVYSSSIQAGMDNEYGKSKRKAEEELFRLERETGFSVYVFRLPNVFGKWSRPDYNSVVATFCYRIARGMPIAIHDASAALSLLYVDDLVAKFLDILNGGQATRDERGFEEISPVYKTTVGELAEILQSFRNSRETLMTERVGSGFLRALHATYLSFLPSCSFSYPIPMHRDERGDFVEMLKTPDCGQFSYFTASPGVTRGGHYHHTKTEKFLVIKGVARFRFRHLLTGELKELIARGGEPQVVETTPGWTHDVTNIGTDELIVMLWANEVFDRDRPDTYRCPL